MKINWKYRVNDDDGMKSWKHKKRKKDEEEDEEEEKENTKVEMM